MKHLLTLALLAALLHSTASSQTIRLTFVGDAMQHGPQIRAARTTDGTYNYSACFTHLAGDIADADFAVVNLECPLGGKPYSGYPNFSAPDEFATALRDAGFDFFATANNHCLDRRDAGLKRTIHRLDELKMPHAGTYLNAAARDTLCPQMVDVNGIRMAMMSYTYGTNGIPVQGKVVVDYINRERIAADIARAREMNADVICAVSYTHLTLPTSGWV